MAEFDRVNGSGVALDRAQKRIQEGQRRGNPPFQEGADITVEISTATTPITVGHKLGRKPQGFMVTSEEGDGVGSLQATDMGSKSITFALRVPVGAPATTSKYRVRVY